MLVDYKKLWILLIERGISKPKFREMANLSPSTMTKLNKSECVSMEVMVRICRALQVGIGDVVDVVME